jgi:hypothetical protein
MQSSKRTSLPQIQQNFVFVSGIESMGLHLFYRNAIYKDIIVGAGSASANLRHMVLTARLAKHPHYAH